MIPKIIHQTWLDDNLPDILKNIVNHNKNLLIKNGYEFKLWTDNDISKLIDEEYPHLNTIFKSTLTGVQRGDIGRLCIIHRFGGVYIDLDILILNDLEDLIDFESNKLYITYEPSAQTMKIYNKNDYICNAFFSANKDNKILKIAINNMYVLFQKYGKSIFQKFDIFGGDYIKETIRGHLEFNNEINIIEERERIFPINDPKFNDLSSSRTDWELLKYKTYPENTIMVHYWIHGDFESKTLLKCFKYDNGKDIQDNIYDFFSELYPKNFMLMN